MPTEPSLKFKATVNNFICLLFFPVPVREQKGGLAQDGGLEQLKSTIYSVESTVAWGKEKADDEV